MLNGKNIRSKRWIEKLDDKMFVAFVIKWKVGSGSNELEFRSTGTIYPVWNVGVLEPYRQDPIGRPE